MRRILAIAFALCLLGAGVLPQARAQLPSVQSDRSFVVFFQEWSAAFDSPARALLARAATAAKASPDAAVTVTGYADPQGSKQANALISALRAQVVVDALVEAGVDAKRITQSANGSTEFALNSIESRRVTISLDPK